MSGPRPVRFVRLFLSLGAIALIVTVGCGKTESKYEYRTEVDELFPPAKTFVRQELKSQFGTPQQLVAWELLPVDFGGIRGRVAEPDGIDGTRQIKIDWADPGADVVVDPGDTLYILDGPYADQQIIVDGYHSGSGVITLPEGSRFEEPIPAGSRLVLHPGQTLIEGRALYHEHCLHCHGVSGDGNGPTAKYLNPPPRDYRDGLYKFKSTKLDDPPTRDDFEKILRHGIPGTYMPSFMLLDDAELHAIIEYVRFLSLRGIYEDVLVEAATGNSFSQSRVDARIRGGETLEEIERAWDEYAAEEIFEFDVDDRMTDVVEEWANTDEPEMIVTPLTPHDSTTTGLVDWLRSMTANSPAVGTVSEVEVETEEDMLPETSMKVDLPDGVRVRSGDVFLWISGENTGQIFEVPYARRGRIKINPNDPPELDEGTDTPLSELVPDYTISEGDQFYHFSEGNDASGNPVDRQALRTTSKVLAYIGQGGTSLTDLLAEAEADESGKKLEQALLTASEERGRAIYLDNKVGCTSCHGPKGLGNGYQTETFQPNKQEGGEYELPGLHDKWGNPIQPRNLTTGIYRGGRRPIDLYRRIYAGIDASGMPPHTSLRDAENEHDFKIWDLINYIYSVPDRSQQPGYFSRTERSSGG